MHRYNFTQPLSYNDMRDVMRVIMAGKSSDEEISLFLKSLAERGETSDEITAAVNVLREHALKLPFTQSLELCDTCGTGGDGSHTINISTLGALVAASAGVKIAKHGNRAASSRCGSADLLKVLGVNMDASPQQVAQSIEQLGFGFCFAPKFHPAMKAVGPARMKLGIRTIFNLVGPLANPARLTFQLLGVSDTALLQPMAEALLRLGIRHGLVVHGDDGLDEVTTTTTSTALEVQNGNITQRKLNPIEWGISYAKLEQIQGGDADENASIALEVLNNKPSAYRDIVVVNAACAMYVSDLVENIKDGVEKASKVLREGKTLELLNKVIGMTVSENVR